MSFTIIYNTFKNNYVKLINMILYLKCLLKWYIFKQIFAVVHQRTCTCHKLLITKNTLLRIFMHNSIEWLQQITIVIAMN